MSVMLWTQVDQVARHLLLAHFVNTIFMQKKIDFSELLITLFYKQTDTPISQKNIGRAYTRLYP